MNDRFAEALDVLQAEFGFSVLTLWGPPADGDSEILAVFMGKDEDAIMAAAIDYVRSDKRES